MFTARTSLACALTVLAGCTVNPKATIVQVNNGEQVLQRQQDSVATFYMQASRLDITFKNTADEGKAAKWAFTVANTPIEATGRRFMLLQHSNLLSRTTLVVAKRPNTDLISSVGSEVADNRIALIQNIASVAKVVVGLAVSTNVAPLQAFTTRFELTQPGDFQTATSATSGWLAWKHKDHDTLTIQIGEAPVTALAYNPTLLRAKMGGLFSSACRPVIVSYTAPNRAAYEWRGKIADPESVEFAALPRKGKVEYHDQCGTSITNEKDPTATPDAVIAAAVAQAAAIKEAYDKADAD